MFFVDITEGILVLVLMAGVVLFAIILLVCLIIGLRRRISNNIIPGVGGGTHLN